MKSYSNFSLIGVDVSVYNPIDDYNALKEDGIDFAIIKIITKSGNPDKLFEKHWTGFEDAGIIIQGVYNYSYATTVEEFIRDAKNVLNVLNGRKCMVWLDVEDESLMGKSDLILKGIDAYANVIHSAGLEFGIYTYQYFYNTTFKAIEKQMQKYPFWIAKYQSKERIESSQIPNVMECPDIDQRLYGWQYCSTGKIDGYNGNLDLNIWFVDVEAQFTPQPTTNMDEYFNNGFREELAVALGLPKTASAAEVLAKTVTISTKTNKNHKAVTPLERFLKYKGYYTGDIEADLGKKPSFGNGMHKASCLYQTKEVSLKSGDGEWTKGNKSYKKALKMI